MLPSGSATAQYHIAHVRIDLLNAARYAKLLPGILHVCCSGPYFLVVLCKGNNLMHAFCRVVPYSYGLTCATLLHLQGTSCGLPC